MFEQFGILYKKKQSFRIGDRSSQWPWRHSWQFVIHASTYRQCHGDFARLTRYLIKTAEIVWYDPSTWHESTIARVVYRTVGFHSSSFTTCFHGAARFVVDIWPRDHVTAALMALHWLLVRPCITYKLCTLMHAVVYGQWATVLDVHGGVCVTTYRQVSYAFSSEGRIRCTMHSHYLLIKILFSGSSTGMESFAGWHSTALHHLPLQATS